MAGGDGNNGIEKGERSGVRRSTEWRRRVGEEKKEWKLHAGKGSGEDERREGRPQEGEGRKVQEENEEKGNEQGEVSR